MDINKPTLKGIGPGMVTVSEWLMGPDGCTYLYFWSYEWLVGNEKEVLGMVARGNSGFFILTNSRSILIPGCRFSCFAGCERPPDRKGVHFYMDDKR